jgi:hypothetical protein
LSNFGLTAGLVCFKLEKLVLFIFLAKGGPMPTEVHYYKCNVCGQEYHRGEEALNCEDFHGQIRPFLSTIRPGLFVASLEVEKATPKNILVLKQTEVVVDGSIISFRFFFNRLLQEFPIRICDCPSERDSSEIVVCLEGGADEVYADLAQLILSGKCEKIGLRYLTEIEKKSALTMFSQYKEAVESLMRDCEMSPVFDEASNNNDDSDETKH